MFNLYFKNRGFPNSIKQKYTKILDNINIRSS